ncbi:SAM-dependent methyltransferase [Streptomyces litchfieldiae]|uniref:SAM-dependent methyltransferase n=1 Tax=Streptomyces litchfieldiae TaxID=3075543 RepID=A0ABU2MRK4_9ACTN|nr:SAM-dependent methyltransferase [Streptomyces sp. DSM 44938]MDT0344255.1 SAM-dependent methyltransferase [Streptomyces sp. DSM 44938]
MTDDASAPRSEAVSKIDTSVPHSARIWNYWLGGTDNYEVDRAAGDAYREAFPGIVDVACGSRRFLARSVRHLALDAGLRQFLDVGTGLPTADNTHQIAQRVAPDSRVVYVDNDPLVLMHSRALLTSTPEGATEFLEGDLRRPEEILSAASGTLDLTRPVGLILSGILGHIPTYEEARAIVRRLMDGLPSGSYLSLNEGTDTEEAYVRAQQAYNESGAIPYRLRSMAEIAGYFDGLELEEPGVVQVPCWRPDEATIGGPADVGQAGGVARKP